MFLLAAVLATSFEPVRIKWHIITREDTGEVSITTEELEEQLQHLNDAFEVVGLQFEADPVVHYMPNTDIFKYGVKPYVIRQYPRISNAINVYWSQTLQPLDIIASSSFSTDAKQGIVIKSGFEPQVLVHAMGHYFNITHNNECSCHYIDCCLQCDGFTDSQIDRMTYAYMVERTVLHNPRIPRCIGDLNGDGEVSVDDLLFLLDDWRGDQADLNGDAWVHLVDIGAIFEHWGLC